MKSRGTSTASHLPRTSGNRGNLQELAMKDNTEPFSRPKFRETMNDTVDV